MKIYLAAPWFSPEQERIHDSVLSVLDASGHKVYSPRREIEVSRDATPEERRYAFSTNCVHIDNSELVICITDYKDIGTIWEAGYAYRALRPIIYYAETLGHHPFNLMLAESGIGVVRSCTQLHHTLQSTTVESMREMCKKWGGPVQ